MTIEEKSIWYKLYNVLEKVEINIELSAIRAIFWYRFYFRNNKIIEEIIKFIQSKFYSIKIHIYILLNLKQLLIDFFQWFILLLKKKTMK